ncbi:type I-B CRISPR-associated protein Cas8b1/Cst1 [Flavobacterium sp. ZB4P13]|uniref:type I-B CRISPR-associated protein Cas8b1/Cst1 n=1 Tax=Flavobacterium sp. ZB4P13 TaxID=3401728 RepID=UPI003AAD8819
MKNGKEKCQDVDELISKNFVLIEQEKEQKIVNLFIEIIVSITLKEYYEKSDTISEIQSIGTK